ncbi:MAG: glycosyltransferase family 4 protein [Bacteroidales bacterium]
MTQSQYQWVVFQVGSREHYAIPRMFHKKQELLVFVTDIWVRPDSWLAWLLRIFKIPFNTRYHYELKNARVIHFSYLFLLIDVLSKFGFLRRLINRDKIASLVFASCVWFLPDRKLVVFSYNYVAYYLFKLLQRKNIPCILGQIDAGPKAGEINRRLFQECFSNKVKPEEDLYLSYGKKWQKECEWAQAIVVNSEWSKKMLIAAGIGEKKMKVIPLAYSQPEASRSFERDFPKAFSEQRPLRVLFMGSLKLLKGIYPLIQAIHNLKNLPVEFYLVGSIRIPFYLIDNLPPNCHIVNRVAKEKTNDYYKFCDVMILPTYSDGFAITQLEAQAWKLPIIASEYCARIISHNKNGLVLNKVDAEAIQTAILEIINNPEKLKYFSANAIDMNEFSLEKIYEQYKQLLEYTNQ